MGKYSGVKSKYIKEKIKKSSWKDSRHIDKLIKFEKYILGESKGMNPGYIIHALKGRYPKEYKAIWMDLDRKGYEKSLKREAKVKAAEKREDAKEKRKGKLAEDRDKKDWVKAGGKL